MKTLYKTSIFLLLVLVGFTTEAKHKKGKYTKTKEVSNSYSVNGNFNLMVDNVFGEVRIETWDKDEVSYQIHITSNGNDEEDVQRRLDEIHIAVDESKSKLSLVTHVNNRKRTSGTFTEFVKGLINGESRGRSSKLHIEINYVIRLPKHANLDLTNDYGFIYIDETKGNTRINSDYGGIRADALLSSTNVINLDYSSGSDIVHMRQGEMNLGYSSIHLHHVGYLDLAADYCTTKIDSIKDLMFNIDYGSVSVNKGRKVEGNADYVQVKIGEIEEIVDINLSYGGVKVNHIKEGFNLASIHADYASVKLGLDYSEEFIIDITTSYASIKGVQDFTKVNSGRENFRGYNINKESKKRVSVDADYGSVSIFPAS